MKHFEMPDGKCPKLICVPPNYDLYMKASAAMVDILREYSPKIQRFSIDECFLDYNDLAEGRQSPYALP